MGKTFKDRSDWSHRDKSPRFKKQNNINLRQYKGLSVQKDEEVLDNEDHFVQYEEDKKYQK